MDNPKLLLRADLIFAVSLVVFFAFILLTIRSAQEVSESRELEQRTYKMLEETEKLMSSMTDIETGSRGFAISGIEEFLDPFESGKKTYKGSFDSLQLFTFDNGQNGRLDTLDRLLKKKLVIAEKIILLRKNHGLESAIDYIAQGEGRIIMDSIRVVIGHTKDAYLSQFAEHLALTNERRDVRRRNFILFSLAAFLFVIVAYAVTRRYMKRILEQRAIQEDLINELAHQNKQLDDFAHITSHNVRGPAGNIGALISMINQDSPLSDYQLIFSKLEKVSQNLMESLNELLGFLEVTTNKGLEQSLISFEEVFYKEKQNLEGEMLKYKVTLEGDFKAAPSITYPRAYLESIMHNLISNAIKYRSPERDSIVKVRTENKDGHVYLHVSDNGLGIDLDKFGHKLFGLRKTFHNNPEARGIGLFMTKTQIEALEGKIIVQSKVGKGTTFTVIFDQ